jgi:hypothetical protein
MQALAPGSDTSLDAAALEAIAGEAPSATLPRDAVVGAALADVAVAAGLQPSKGATRRLIKVRCLGSIEGQLSQAGMCAATADYALLKLGRQTVCLALVEYATSAHLTAQPYCSLSQGSGRYKSVYICMRSV